LSPLPLSQLGVVLAATTDAATHRRRRRCRIVVALPPPSRLIFFSCPSSYFIFICHHAADQPPQVILLPTISIKRSILCNPRFGISAICSENLTAGDSRALLGPIEVGMSKQTCWLYAHYLARLSDAAGVLISRATSGFLGFLMDMLRW
jgi:hypothetical protein